MPQHDAPTAPSDQPADQRGYRPSRRIVFTGMASLGVAAALAGCGGGGGSSSGDGGATGSGSPSAKAGAELTKTSEVPVGGGVILADEGIVVTQPTEGTFKAFSATCTHQGFTVTSVEDKKIMCNHHGSEYSAATGEVERGPAQAALKEVKVLVKGDAVQAA